jgi:hypothetical protein
METLNVEGLMSASESGLPWGGEPMQCEAVIPHCQISVHEPVPERFLLGAGSC